jgi:hypothetical protein
MGATPPIPLQRQGVASSNLLGASLTRMTQSRSSLRMTTDGGSATSANRASSSARPPRADSRFSGRAMPRTVVTGVSQT